MSSDADALVAIFNSFYNQAFCTLAASVIFIYDTFVTFDREVACFWTAKPTGASLLFFANKWIAMAVYVTNLVSFASFPSDKSCATYQMAAAALISLQVIPGGIFSALRGYALSRSKFLGLIILALSLVQVGANLSRYGYHISGENVPSFGCLETDTLTEAIGFRLTIISRVPVIVADILLLWITWTKISSRAALQDIRQYKRLSLSDILFRDGTIYFVVLFVLNVLHLVLSLTATATNGPEGSDVTYFSAPLTAILISRFLLDLQEADQKVVRLDPHDPLHTSRDLSDVPSFISSIGAFINPDVPASSLSDDELDSELHGVSRSADWEEGGHQAS